MYPPPATGPAGQCFVISFSNKEYVLVLPSIWGMPPRIVSLNVSSSVSLNRTHQDRPPHCIDHRYSPTDQRGLVRFAFPERGQLNKTVELVDGQAKLKNHNLKRNPG